MIDKPNRQQINNVIDSYNNSISHLHLLMKSLADLTLYVEAEKIKQIKDSLKIELEIFENNNS